MGMSNFDFYSYAIYGAISIVLIAYLMPKSRQRGNGWNTMPVERLHGSDESRWHAMEQMPLELLFGEILHNEQDIEIDSPPLYGTPDQVYKNEDGQLLIVDTKFRAKPEVRFSDRVQMSVYAYMLATKIKNPEMVCGHGYIRFVRCYGDDHQQQPGMVRYEKVPLLDMETIELMSEVYLREYRDRPGRLNATSDTIC